MYGIHIKDDRVSIMCTKFSNSYVIPLFQGLPQDQLRVMRYPSENGLSLSNPVERSQVLCLMHELRKHTLSIDTTSVKP